MKFETRMEVLRISDIVAPPYNPREDIERGSPEYKALRRSIEINGMVEPPVVNLHNMRCIGGNQRLAVLRDMGKSEVLCSVIDQPEEAKEKKLCLALNRIDGRWDTDKLGDLLRDDEVIEYETGFDHDELLVYRQLEDMADPGADYFDGDGEDLEDQEGEEPEEDQEDQEPDDEPSFSTTLVRIGHLHFKVEVVRYKRLIEAIRDTGVFDEHEIADEIKRRLLEHD